MTSDGVVRDANVGISVMVAHGRDSIYMSSAMHGEHVSKAIDFFNVSKGTV